MREGKEEAGAKFADYFDFAEPFTKLPSHRILAMFRGEKEEVLDLVLEPEEPTEPAAARPAYERAIAAALRHRRPRAGPADKWLLDTVRWAWRTRILVHLGIDLRMRLWQAAEDEAVRVFAANLRDLLLAAPGRHPRHDGPGPGLPHRREGRRGRRHRQGGRHRHDLPARAAPAVGRVAGHAGPAGRGSTAVELIAIGNGTASRETDKLAAELIKQHPELKLTKVVVSEAGASVYSASAYASQELPELDVSLRGAVSIARRLQDPLAELVKIDPKSIGVGQYQHDLSEVEAVPLAGRGGRGLRERASASTSTPPPRRC